MNKYEAAHKISMPRAGIAKISLLPLAKRIYRSAGECYFSRLHDAQTARQASWSAAIDAVMVRHAQ